MSVSIVNDGKSIDIPRKDREGNLGMKVEDGNLKISAAKDDAKEDPKTTQAVTQEMKSIEQNEVGGIFDSNLKEVEGLMSPLPLTNCFGELQSPQTSTMSELTPKTTGCYREATATIANLLLQKKTGSNAGIKGKEVINPEGKTEVSVEVTVEGNSTRKLDSASSASNTYKKTSKDALNPDSVQSTAMVVDNNSVNELGDQTNVSTVAQKQLLIDSLRNNECTVASLLSTLVRSSKDLIDESKFSELQSTSTLKLTRENLLKNENFSKDYSPSHSQVLSLARKVERMMNDTIKALIVDAYHCVQREIGKDSRT